ncbi:Protein of unknown function [Bacillus mycoides]|uniref:Uncharacterized protein n=1 Tax=Bacillus mycoides TaxID=1405 RepID=A0A1G4EJD3_BACMY|nr:Protein of unknown function [Bacillus mycoides]
MIVVVDVTVTAIVMNVVSDVTVIVTSIAMTVGIGKSHWKSALRKSTFFVQEFSGLIY